MTLISGRWRQQQGVDAVSRCGRQCRSLSRELTVSANRLHSPYSCLCGLVWRPAGSAAPAGQKEIWHALVVHAIFDSSKVLPTDGQPSYAFNNRRTCKGWRLFSFCKIVSCHEERKGKAQYLHELDHIHTQHLLLTDSRLTRYMTAHGSIKDRRFRITSESHSLWSGHICEDTGIYMNREFFFPLPVKGRGLTACRLWQHDMTIASLP